MTEGKRYHGKQQVRNDENSTVLALQRWEVLLWTSLVLLPAAHSHQPNFSTSARPTTALQGVDKTGLQPPFWHLPWQIHEATVTICQWCSGSSYNPRQRPDEWISAEMWSNKTPHTRIPHLLHVEHNPHPSWYPFPKLQCGLRDLPKRVLWMATTHRSELTLRDENHLPFQAWGFTLSEKLVFSREILGNKKGFNA